MNNFIENIKKINKKIDFIRKCMNEEKKEFYSHILFMKLPREIIYVYKIEKLAKYLKKLKKPENKIQELLFVKEKINDLIQVEKEYEAEREFLIDKHLKKEELDYKLLSGTMLDKAIQNAIVYSIIMKEEIQKYVKEIKKCCNKNIHYLETNKSCSSVVGENVLTSRKKNFNRIMKKIENIEKYVFIAFAQDPIYRNDYNFIMRDERNDIMGLYCDVVNIRKEVIQKCIKKIEEMSLEKAIEAHSSYGKSLEIKNGSDDVYNASLIAQIAT